MMIAPDVLIVEFADAAGKAAIRGWPCSLRFEQRPAPHDKPELPPGEGAVYVFAIGSAYGSSAPCGPGTVLKVGKVGPGNRPARRIAPLMVLLGQHEEAIGFRDGGPVLVDAAIVPVGVP